MITPTNPATAAAVPTGSGPRWCQAALCRRAALLVSAVIACAGASHAGSAAESVRVGRTDPIAQAPRFAVRAATTAGEPVRSLTVADFAATSQGRAVAIESVQEVDRPTRALGILIDDAQLLYTSVDTAFRVRQLGETLIGGLSPADRTVVTRAGGARAALTATSDRRVAAEALETAYRSILTSSQETYDAGLSLQALDRIVDVVARAEADVPLVVYVTRPAFSITGANDSARSRALTAVVSGIVERARRAGVIIYTIAPDERVTATRNRIDGYEPFLADVANDTGGLFLMPRADAAGAAQQILRDTSHVYRLVLDPGAAPLDLDAVTVTARGEGTTVRTTLAPAGR